MPRDGLQDYHAPPGTDGISNFTVESSRYNVFVHDVEQDLNTPRPIKYGGTGTDNAAGAMANLSGETEGQIITNYDSDIFVSGSFYSASSATAPPVAGHAFVGICYSSDLLPPSPAAPLNQNLVIHARDQNDTVVPGRVYVREKKAGLWSAWFAQAGSTSDLDAVYVNVTGDTMTGALAIQPAAGNATLALVAPVGASSDIIGGKPSLPRWLIRPGDSGAESGGNVGSDFAIRSYNDAGAPLDLVLAGTRSTGLLTVKADPTAPLGIATKQMVDVRVRYDAPHAPPLTTDVGVTIGQKTQARRNIYAAPFDAMAYNGMQINGSMEVSQQNGTSPVTVTVGGVYVVDGWMVVASSGVISAVQVPGGIPSGADGAINNFLSVTASTGVPNAASTFAEIIHNIEGYNTARLGWGSSTVAQPITIGFWIYPSVAGTMGVSVRNSGASRSYVTNVPVAALAWQYNTITVPGDIAGTWLKDNMLGMQVVFALAGGSNYQTTAGVWTAGNFIASSAQTNMLAANGSYVYFGGVVILPGIEAPSAARSTSIMRPYDRELLLCKRQLTRLGANQFYGPGTLRGGGLNAYCAVSLAVPMRVAPAVTQLGNYLYCGDGAALFNNLGVTYIPGADVATLIPSVPSSIGTGGGGVICFTGSGYMQLDARL